MTANVTVIRTLGVAVLVLLVALVAVVLLALNQPRPASSVVIQTSYGATVLATQVVRLP